MKFADIIGQNKTKNYLVRTVRNSRVSHAQLFLGPEGSGKLALALAYAQYINCENKVDFGDDAELIGDSCGTCPSCVKFTTLAHPDLHFFFPVATNKDVTKKPQAKLFLPVWREVFLRTKGYLSLNEWYDELGFENKQGIINADDCDEITKSLGYKAFEAEYKIVLIWHAEKLFHSAAPKILKILEEPPEKTLFLLVCGSFDLLLSTIISRTQMVKVPRLTDKDIISTLINNHGCSETIARRIAILCSGNITEALKLIDKTEEEDFNFSRFRDWMRYCFKPDVRGMISFSDEMAKVSREGLKNFFAYSLRVTRNCLLYHGNAGKLVKLEGEELEWIRDKFHPFINTANATSIEEEFSRAIFHLERNANARILLLDLSFTLASLLKIKVSQPQSA
ncbi:MAG: DNA polymerase III subunit delta [Bacteroidota bacterium]